MDIYDEKRIEDDLPRRREFKTRSEEWIRCDESLLHVPNHLEDNKFIVSRRSNEPKRRVVEANRIERTRNPLHPQQITRNRKQKRRENEHGKLYYDINITDEEEEVALYKCEDIRIDNIMNLLTCQPTQAEIEEKSYNARLKKAKQDKLSEDNLYSKQTQQWTNKLANHFNRGIK